MTDWIVLHHPNERNSVAGIYVAWKRELPSRYFAIPDYIAILPNRVDQDVVHSPFKSPSRLTGRIGAIASFQSSPHSSGSSAAPTFLLPVKLLAVVANVCCAVNYIIFNST